MKANFETISAPLQRYEPIKCAESVTWHLLSIWLDDLHSAMSGV